jgi:membrane associated rhomboid family serine protease
MTGLLSNTTRSGGGVFRFNGVSAKRPAGAVKSLIIANGAVFFLMYFFLQPHSSGFASFTLNFAFTPYAAIGRLELWQFFSYMFLHGSFWHLAMNMFALFVFGRAVEQRLGRTRFLLLYFACGIGAAACQALFGYDSRIPMVGASGATMGMAAAFAYFYPNSVLYVLGILPVRAWKLVLFYAAMELINWLEQSGSRIAHAAHFGGIVVALVVLETSYRQYILGRLFPGTAREKPAADQKERSRGKTADRDEHGKVIELSRDRDGWWR